MLNLDTSFIIPILTGIKFELTEEGLTLIGSDTDLSISTFILSLSHVCSSLTQPIFGYLSDVWKRRFFVFFGMLLSSIFLPLLIATIKSGINLSIPQSPPPITFPALAVAKDIEFLSCKKERLYEEDIISTQPFDDEYIS